MKSLSRESRFEYDKLISKFNALEFSKLMIRIYREKFDPSEGEPMPFSFDEFKNLSKAAGTNQDGTGDSQKTDATTEQPVTSSAEAPLVNALVNRDVARLDFTKESEQDKDANSAPAAAPSVILSASLAEEASVPIQTGGDSPDGDSANGKLGVGEQVICDGNRGVIVAYVCAILGLSFLKSILTA